MLDVIPDIPIFEMTSDATVAIYRYPTNPMGYRYVAKNLRDLAVSYASRMKAKEESR